MKNNPRDKLFQKKLPYTARSEKGLKNVQTVFLEAITQSNVEMVRSCLSQDIDPNMLNMDMEPVVHLLAKNDECEIFNELYNTGKLDVDVAFESRSPLMVAVQYNRRDMVNALLNAGANPNYVGHNDNTPLHYACKTKSMGLVYDLIMANADPSPVNIFNETPLTLSVISFPSLPIVRYLLKKGATFREQKDAMPVLLEAVLNCNNRDRLTILDFLMASWDRKKESNKFLTRHPLTKMNCLHIVAITGYAPCARLLLDFGVSLNMADVMGRTPCEIARQHGSFEVLHVFRKFKKVYFDSASFLIPPK